ncbi:MAG: hypothetical protein JWM72_4442 [Actinomycetia bacterium]|nr:hypothetical protein [Actinomycetes bacterium]
MARSLSRWSQALRPSPVAVETRHMTTLSRPLLWAVRITIVLGCAYGAMLPRFGRDQFAHLCSFLDLR